MTRGEERPRRRGPVVAAAILATLGVGLSGAFLHEPDAVAGRPVLSAELPEYATWRWPQSWKPLHRVAMTFRFHSDEDFVPLHSAHQALVGEDLHTVRYLDGSHAPETLVSEDGAHLASQEEDTVRIENLETGERVDVPIAGT